MILCDSRLKTRSKMFGKMYIFTISCLPTVSNNAFSAHLGVEFHSKTRRPCLPSSAESQECDFILTWGFQSTDGREALLIHYTNKICKKSLFWHILNISFIAIFLAHVQILVFEKHVKMLVQEDSNSSKRVYFSY